MLTRKRLLILIAVLLIGGCTFQLMREIRGPSPATAFQWTFDTPVPDYADSLNAEYYSHLKGYGIYIGFRVPPARLSEIIDIESSVALYNDKTEFPQPWRNESKFRNLFPNNFPDLKACREIKQTTDGAMREIVYCPLTGHVFCWFVRDSDIEP